MSFTSKRGALALAFFSAFSVFVVSLQAPSAWAAKPALKNAPALKSAHAPKNASALKTAPSPIAPALAIPPVKFIERTLPNGLQVISLPSNTSPTVSVQICYRVGSKDDPAGRSGFAHLFEHLMFKSTRNLKSEQFDRMTEDVGGSNNASTSEDVTTFQSLVPSNHLEILLWAEAERMSNLNVDQGNFVSERAVVEEEYRQTVLASPYGLLFNSIPALAYQVHPYKRPVIGSIPDLDSAKLDDVVAFHNTYYRPDNATLIVAGDFDPKQLDVWVDRYFGRLTKPNVPIPRVGATEPPWPADRTNATTAPKVPLPAVALVWLGPTAKSADAPALQVASALLSSGESSRLNQSLVYRQRIAGQASFEADLRDGPGLLTATAVAAGGKSLAAVKDALLAEVLRLARQPATTAELAKVKTQVVTGALLSRQTPEGLASAMADAAVMQGNANKINTGLVDLQNVTAADVTRVMQRYVANAHLVAITYTQAPGQAPE